MQNKNKYSASSTLLCLLLFFIGSSSLHAQKYFASASLDSVKIKIGDQTYLNFKVEAPAGTSIKFPEISDTLNSHLEVVSQSKVDTSYTTDKQRYILRKKVLITSFDSGYFAIAPFAFIVNADTANPVYSEALLIQVQTVTVDTTQAIRDIKGPKDAPWNFREIIPYLVFAGLAVLLTAIVLYYWRKRKTKPVVEVINEPKVPAHHIALAELQKLRDEKLWQEGKYKIYQIKLTDIIRTYIEARFSINALEQTTDETMRSFRAVHLPEELRFKLKQLLVLSDMVKFAKEQPLPAENEKSMEDAVEFVTATAKVYTELAEKEVQS